MNFMQTPEEIRELFKIDGISVAEWARRNGFPSALVYRVLRGEAQCLRGQSHRIGVALGLKPAPSPTQIDQIQRLMNK